MSKFWIIILTLACIVFLLVMLWRSPPAELSGFLHKPPSVITYPTTFITRAHTKQYSETGQLSYTLDAKTINYYENQQASQPDIILEQPYFIIYDNNEMMADYTASMTVSADTAEGREKEDQLTLIGNVVLEQIAINGDVTQLNTEQLNIQPRRRYAETSKAVIITDKTGTTTATGLKVFFNDKRIELLSNVKGSYAPQ